MVFLLTGWGEFRLVANGIEGFRALLRLDLGLTVVVSTAPPSGDDALGVRGE
jgi:hypothetical protein